MVQYFWWFFISVILQLPLKCCNLVPHLSKDSDHVQIVQSADEENPIQTTAYGKA